MASVTLLAQPRAGSGKGVARKLRRANRIPAILYGYGTEPQSISLDSVELRKALGTAAGIRAILQLEIEGGGKYAALVKEIQRHPVSREILHADLAAINLDEPVELAVPIKATGIPVGVKEQDGTLEWQRRELEIRVLPTQIPESIELDVSGLEVNQALHISDVQLEGAELLGDPEMTICSVNSSSLTLEAEPEAEGEGEDGEGAAEGEDGEVAAETPAGSGDE